MRTRGRFTAEFKAKVALEAEQRSQLKTDPYGLYKSFPGTLPWGQWDWPLTVSAPERAVLELLDELPDRESLHQVDVLFEGCRTSARAALRSCWPTAAA